MNILHITAHLGAGIGKAISGITQNKNNPSSIENRILLLEKPLKTNYVEVCNKNEIPVIMYQKEDFHSHLDWADIVVVSWWHHPSMAYLLANFPAIPCRLILWSHINGCSYPYFLPQLSKVADYLFFTTPYSLKNPLWTEEERIQVIQNSSVIYGMGDFQAKNLPYKQHYTVHSSFTIGYAGTLNYSKLHPQFPMYCMEVIKKIENVKFVMAGDPSDALLQDIKKYGLEKYIIFTGYVNNLSQVFLDFDVFAYPLNPDHFGTTENVLLEAMAAALPIVVLKHGPEEHIITNEMTGFLADSPSSYATVLEKLYLSENLRQTMGIQARSTAIHQFDSKINKENFYQLCKKVLGFPKRIHDFSSVFGQTPWDWFCSCTGDDNVLFKQAYQSQFSSDSDKLFIKEQLKNIKAIYKEKTKGSIFHFADHFPEDEKLVYIKQLLSSQE